NEEDSRIAFVAADRIFDGYRLGKQSPWGARVDNDRRGQRRWGAQRWAVGSSNLVLLRVGMRHKVEPTTIIQGISRARIYQYRANGELENWLSNFYGLMIGSKPS